MKKLILTVTILMGGLFSMQAQYPFYENFDAMTTNAAPTGGWVTSGFKVMAGHGSTAPNACSVEMKTGHLMDTLVTPTIGPLTATSIISLDYRFVQAALYPANAYTLTAGDQITIDVNVLGNWFNNQASITTSNGLTTFTTFTFTNASASGLSVKIRLDIARANGDWFLDIDNVFIKDAGSTYGIKYNPSNPPSLLALPNPSQGNFIVWLKNYQSSNTVELKLYNHMGQLVRTMKPDNVLNNQFNVTTTDLAKGVYIVEVISGDEVSKTKVIVE